MAFQDALEMMFPLVRRKGLPRIAATVAAVRHDARGITC